MSNCSCNDYLFGSLTRYYVNMILDIAEITHPYKNCNYVLVKEFSPKKQDDKRVYSKTYQKTIHKNKRGYFIIWNNFNIYTDGKVTKRRNKENK